MALVEALDISPRVLKTDKPSLNIWLLKQCDAKERQRALASYEAACKIATKRNNGRLRAYTAPEQVPRHDIPAGWLCHFED